MPLQFISSDRDCSLLVGPYPVRERAVFDFERQFLARYRIRPKRRDASLHYCLVLIGSRRCAVVGCKFRKVTTRIQVDKATIAGENNDPFRIVAKCRRSAPIRAHCFGRNQGPDSDEFQDHLVGTVTGRSRAGVAVGTCVSSHAPRSRVGSRRGSGFDDADVSSILPIIPYGGFSPVRLQG